MVKEFEMIYFDRTSEIMEHMMMKAALPAPTALPATMTVSALSASSSTPATPHHHPHHHHHHHSSSSSRLPTSSSATSTDWDINDATVPAVTQFDNFQEWADGHCRYVYSPDCEQGKRHTSGWAMRNTNNHNVHILKKSCLGVLVCSLGCKLPCGSELRLRPAICDKARKKQLGKACPNPRCAGYLQILPCKGHCGYPVTHFWRHTQTGIFFQAKGVHDHPRPETKKSVEVRKKILSSQQQPTGLPKKIRVTKKAIIQNSVKSGLKIRRKRKQALDKRSSSHCPGPSTTDPYSLSKSCCYRCGQSPCICSLDTKLGVVGGSSNSGTSSWSLAPGSSVAAAAAAAASWAVTSSITITPPPLTHHHHHHPHHHHHHTHMPTYHHHHQQPTQGSSTTASGTNSSAHYQSSSSSSSAARVLEFPQFSDSSTTTTNAKLPASSSAAAGGNTAPYPSVPSEGFFKPSDIFHLDYYENNGSSGSGGGHHPPYYGAGNNVNPYSDYGGGNTAAESLIADTALQSLSAGTPWTIPTMPYTNALANMTPGANGGGGGGGRGENGNGGNSSSSSAAAGIWSGKAEMNGGAGSYLSSLATDYSGGEFYPGDCFNYYFDNNNYCWAQQQSLSNQTTSNLYP